MKTCFLFGHRIASDLLLPQVVAAAKKQYLQYGVRVFVVGSRGAFDRIAASAIRLLKRHYGDISLLLLGHAALPDGFDGYAFPSLKPIPDWQTLNQAADSADTVVCYVIHGGRADRLLKYVRGSTRAVIENIAEA